jgi:hypothetical protein
MKAITVTQELKDSNADYFKNDIVGSIKRIPTTPNNFNSLNYNIGKRTDGYHTLPPATHRADGFYSVISPSYDTTIEKLGDLIFDEVGQFFTYEVVTLTEEEIQQRLIGDSESAKEQIIQQIAEDKIIDEAQTFDDTNALDVKDLFPMWVADFDYTLDFKCKHFTVDNELVLFKCVQPHISQADWQPRNVPALFTRVAYPNEIPVFVQPTGAQDAYMIGNQVYFPTANDSVYESLIDNNVYSPTAYPAGWQLIS